MTKGVLITNYDVSVHLKENSNIYDIKRPNGMTCINENKLNKTTECNLINDMLNPSKHTKFLNSHQSTILHGCMNTRKDREKCNNFHILMDSRRSSTIIMRRLITKINPKRYAVMQWHTQEGNIITNLNVKIDYTLPEVSATKIVTWNCHVDESTKIRHDMILGINLLI